MGKISKINEELALEIANKFANKDNLGYKW